MKALTLTQPWASLVAVGAKKVETRDWSTSYRGPLAIHASAGFPREARLLCLTEPFYAALKAAGFDTVHKPEKVLPLGMVVAVCTLVNVVRVENTVDAHSTVMDHLRLNYSGAPCFQDELAFGDYSVDRYMWLLSNAYWLPRPIPARGSLGLWSIDIQDPRGGVGCDNL